MPPSMIDNLSLRDCFLIQASNFSAEDLDEHSADQTNLTGNLDLVYLEALPLL